MRQPFHVGTNENNLMHSDGRKKRLWKRIEIEALDVIHVGKYLIRRPNPDAQFDVLVVDDKFVKVGFQLSP